MMFHYIDDVFVNHNRSELEIRNTTDSIISVLYLDLYLDFSIFY
jgi:hypothetical protein